MARCSSSPARLCLACGPASRDELTRRPRPDTGPVRPSSLIISPGPWQRYEITAPSRSHDSPRRPWSALHGMIDAPSNTVILPLSTIRVIVSGSVVQRKHRLIGAVAAPHPCPHVPGLVRPGPFDSTKALDAGNPKAHRASRLPRQTLHEARPHAWPSARHLAQPLAPRRPLPFAASTQAAWYL
jgi:hypothetical protein